MPAKTTTRSSKPIDIKDIERGQTRTTTRPRSSTIDFDKFKDLLTSRSGNWEQLLCVIENRGKVTIKSPKEFINSLDDSNYKSIKEQSDTHAQHLKKFLENLHRWRAPSARDPDRSVTKVMELMREVTYKGRNRKHRFIGLKEKALSPRRIRASDLDKILTERRHEK